MIPLIDEQLPDDRGTLTAKPVGLLKATAMGVMKGAADIAGAADIGLGGLAGFAGDVTGLFGDEEAQDAFYKYRDYAFTHYDEKIKTSKDFWTPDPASTSNAGKILHGIGGLAVPIMTGPAAVPLLMAESALNTGVEQVDKGVDSTTATMSGIGAELINAAQIKLPASGKNLWQTIGLIAANPILGAGQAQGTKMLLESQGYKNQAKEYDPFDPVGRSIDIVLGVVFGGMAHYRSARKKLPIEAEDAIDTVAAQQKAVKDTPFDQSNKSVAVNLQAKDKAILDVAEGKPVDVSEQIRDIRAELPESFRLPELQKGLKEHFKLSEEQTAAVTGLIEARAKMTGESVDDYIGKRMAGIITGDASVLPRDALYQKIPSFSDIETTVKSRDFIESFFNAEAIPDKKAGYIYEDLGEKQALIQKASEFLTQYGKYDYNNPIEGKYGHKMFFAPSDNAIERLGIEKAYAEYALHSVTSRKNIEDHGTRLFDKNKAVSLPAIEKIIKEADGFKEEGESLFYYKKIREGKKPYGVIVLELSKVGDKALFEGYRFITHLPDKKESYIEKIGLSQKSQLRETSGGEQAGTASAEPNNILTPGEGDVNTLEQRAGGNAKAAVQFLEDGRAVIHAFEKADITSVVHELGHIFRRDLKGENLNITEQWAGVENGKWERQHDEQFARALERYFAEGSAPSEELRGIFEEFKTWMLDIYRRVIGDNIWNVKISPEVRIVFDRLFVEKELPLKKEDLPETTEARAMAKEAIKEIQPPEEITTQEDWGTGETFVQSRKGKMAEGFSKRPKPGSAIFDFQWSEEAPKAEADKAHLEFIRDRLATSEGPGKTYDAESGAITGRTSSAYPKWFKDRGFKQKEIIGIADKALEGKSLTERQQGMLDDLIASSEQEYRKAHRILNEPIETLVENIFDEQGDVPHIKGYDAQGKPIAGGMKEMVDQARAEYYKTKSLEDAYERIGNCIRMGG